MYDPNDEKDVAIVDGLIAEATKGLTTKRDQLLNETKTLKKQLSQAGSDPGAMERLQAELDASQAALETANGNIATLTKDAKKTTKTLEAETAFNRNLLVDNGLTDAFVKANVAKQFLPAVKALFSSKVEIKAEGDTRKAYIGDKLLEVAITEWSQSDEGKNYVAAQNNAGGGANGGGGAKATGKTITRSAFDAMPLHERGPAMAGGTTIVDG